MVTRLTGGAYAALTDKGRDTLSWTWPVYAAGIAEHFGGHISGEEAHVLTEAPVQEVLFPYLEAL